MLLKMSSHPQAKQTKSHLHKQLWSQRFRFCRVRRRISFNYSVIPTSRYYFAKASLRWITRWSLNRHSSVIPFKSDSRDTVRFRLIRNHPLRSTYYTLIEMVCKFTKAPNKHADDDRYICLQQHWLSAQNGSPQFHIS